MAGANTGANDQWTAVSSQLKPFINPDERSDKLHQLLLNNCSNKRRSDGSRFSIIGVAAGHSYAGDGAAAG